MPHTFPSWHDRLRFLFTLSRSGFALLCSSQRPGALAVTLFFASYVGQILVLTQCLLQPQRPLPHLCRLLVQTAPSCTHTHQNSGHARTVAPSPEAETSPDRKECIGHVQRSHIQGFLYHQSYLPSQHNKIYTEDHMGLPGNKLVYTNEP